MKLTPARSYAAHVLFCDDNRRVVALSLLGATLFWCGCASALDLQSDTDTATAGYFRLVWQSSAPAPIYQLEESTDPAFSDPDILYRGPDTARTISGRSNGTYYYRARTVTGSNLTGNWSRPVKVTVAHHSLMKAGGFFAVGALVFLSTLGLIINGHRRHQKEYHI